MNSQLLKAKVTELHNKLADTRKEINLLQSICTHEDFKYENKGSTGNWDRGDDSWWTNFTCNICRKKWTEDGTLRRHKYLPE